jgi:8-oxo-dGTP pyrophosphatase MutT (NUDIX family)
MKDFLNNRPPMTNKTPHFSGKVSVKIILKNSRSGKVLIVRDPEDSDWQLPGGRTEEGENFYQTIARELVEELRLKLSQFKINFVYNEQVLHT